MTNDHPWVLSLVIGQLKLGVVMSIPTDLLPTTCDVFRPFGDAAPTYRDVPCRLVPDFARGQGVVSGGPAWTHYLVLDVAADVRDACTRMPGVPQVSYADGD